MRKGPMRIVLLLCTVFCLLLAGCGAKSAESGSSARQTTEGEQAMNANGYTTQEIWVQNGSNRIYGIAYVPNKTRRFRS